MLNTNRVHILPVQGLLLVIALMLCMSLCVLASVAAEAEDPLLYDETNSTVVGIKEGKEVPPTLKIPENVKKIGMDAFFNVNEIKYLELPSTLEAIEQGAFSDCEGLIEVTIPGNVDIGPTAFSNCTSLKKVKILYGGSTIGYSAFYNCTNLSEVELAPDVVFTGDNAFTESGVPTIFTCKYTPPAEAVDGTLSDAYADKLVGMQQAVKQSLPAGSEAAYAYTVSGDNVTVTKYHGSNPDPEIPETINGKNVTVIDAGAFCGPTNVTSVTVRSRNTEIKDGALPDNVTLRCYSDSKAKNYADEHLNGKFDDLNLTEKHKVTVAGDSTSWLSFSVGNKEDGSDAVDADRYTELNVVPNDYKYITVWIKQMNDENDFLDHILIQTDGTPGPGDDQTYGGAGVKKSVYVIIAEAQSELEPGATSVPENLRRYTFPMPGANIKVSAGLDQLVKGPAVPDSNGGIPGDDPSPPPSLP